MAFGATSILDNFNRSNTGPPPSSNWTSSGRATDGWKVVSNQCVPNGSSEQTEDYWNVADFGPDCEVYATVISNGQAWSLIARLTDEDTSSPDGYWLGADSGAVTINRLDDGADTQLGASISQAVDADDRIGFELIGSTLKFYFSNEGAAWSEVASRTDSNYSSAGRIGLSAWPYSGTITVDDFGGGTVTTSVSGTLSKTLDGVTKSIAGTVAIDGDLTKTLGDLSKSIAGTVAVDGDLTKDLEAFTLSSAGTVGGEITGSLSKTLDDLSKSIAGTVDVTGTTSKTLDDLSKSIAGTVDVVGSVTKTLDDLSKSIAGTVDVVGSSAPTLAGVTLSSAGEVTSGISGNLDKTLDDLSKSIAGTVDVTGSAAPTLEGVTLSAEGDTSLVGTLSAVLGDISYSLAATVAVDGDLDKTLEGLGLAAAGVVGDIESNGVLDATLGDLSVSLAGTVAIVGAAAPTLADVTSSATGVIMTGVLGDQMIQDGLMVKALATNAGLVWIGKHSDDTVSNLTGFELAAGETVTFDWVDNLADIYINQAVETDELCWIKLFV